MRILFFGTYDAETITRVRVLQEGFAALGDEVLECNVPLPLDTAKRVRMVQRPWLIPVLAAQVGSTWLRLLRRTRGIPRPDAVVVGYMGHFDVHLARRLWPRQPLVLDHLVSGRDTALDRRVHSRALLRLLGWIDRWGLAAADVPVVDTEEDLELVPAQVRPRTLVVDVGAPARWFHPPRREERRELRVVFYGSFTPLHGGPVIGEAIAHLAARGSPVRFSLVGRGQDFEATRSAAGAASTVDWISWIDPADLPVFVNGHDVALGIFGTTRKAQRVVPMKVFNSAAAGCAVVTSETAPQRRALGEAGTYVAPGDGAALADVLSELAEDPERVWQLRLAAYRRARLAFRAENVVRELRTRLLEHAAK